MWNKYAMLYTLHSAESKIVVLPHCDIATLKSEKKLNKQMIQTVADNVK